jgi:hypothetical protein
LLLMRLRRTPLVAASACEGIIVGDAALTISPCVCVCQGALHQRRGVWRCNCRVLLPCRLTVHVGLSRGSIFQ